MTKLLPVQDHPPSFGDVLGGRQAVALALVGLVATLVVGCNSTSEPNDPIERYRADCEIVLAEDQDGFSKFTEDVLAMEPQQLRFNWTIEELPDGSLARRFAAIPRSQRTEWEKDSDDDFKSRISSAFARSWPVTSEQSLTGVLRDFWREISPSANYESFASMRPEVNATIDSVFY